MKEQKERVRKGWPKGKKRGPRKPKAHVDKIELPELKPYEPTKMDCVAIGVGVGCIVIGAPFVVAGAVILMVSL